MAASPGLATLTVGSDTGGSITYLSYRNANIGIRPFTGLTSRSGVVPITHVRDTIGPMCKSVKDAAYLPTTTAGPCGDPGDNYTDAIPFDSIPSYASCCFEDSLAGVRLSVPRNIFKAEFTNETGPTGGEIQQVDALVLCCR